MTIFGWDASDFDWLRGPMDLAAAARDGISFFTHKATEGTRTKHIHYGEALTRARSAGIPFIGAYVVPRTPGNNSHGSVSAQVDYFLAYLDLHTPWWRTNPGFFLQVDTEKWGYDNVSPAVGAQMCDLLRARTGKWVVHYAPGWAYGNSIPGDHPLWASSYGSNPVVPYRNGYRGDSAAGWTAYSGRTPTFLQFGSRVTIGSQPGCDINAFRGTVDQLRALITGGGGGDMAGEADKAFSAPYTGVESWISGQSWAAKAIEKPLRKANEQLDDLVKAIAQLSASGTSLDTAAIIANQNVARDEARAKFAELLAQVARLEGENRSLRLRLAQALAPTE